jgi:hypothetical protein
MMDDYLDLRALAFCLKHSVLAHRHGEIDAALTRFARGHRDYGLLVLELVEVVGSREVVRDAAVVAREISIRSA